MKLRLFFFLLFFNSGAVWAQSRPLPSVYDNSAYPAANASTAKPSSANTLYEVLGRVEQLQAEVQQLRGIVEEQAFTITELKKRQNTIYDDLDQRMQSLETSGSAGSAEKAAPAPEAQPPAASATPPAAVPVIPAQPAVTAQAPVKPAVSATEAVPAPAASAAAVSGKSRKERYQEAYDTLKDGHYSQAITALNAFLKDYPAGEYSDNAQYWLGEAYKVNQEVSLAREAFSKVVSNYPASPKVSDALLKLGYIEFEQNNKAKAGEYFSQITTRFPGTTAAHLAAKKMQQIESGAP
ncbi:MAG: tol-pal system protein YbgF [Methylicorpusculum sp.]|uniref:tol-pal system protein YbgF n=3 Tax=Methylicorpusculum sp. TaxID=2713644 RepID=UPI0027175ED0|nr:tol-pal system protein YbgF [Methylicorpusculum sp.]MDO9241713.1 tol-pal system protein YbgF [Methylicorpusculum sp.]MDP2179763.1 tol-pal system protein YbgF [Methylicorpusculum sp.]MDP2201779.1 tol-pal system protein YbgF [Methylicorpusculum sp.]MDP3530932.1 tol-pal system protein YbgF [Methylicorpusculum sp.]